MTDKMVEIGKPFQKDTRIFGFDAAWWRVVAIANPTPMMADAFIQRGAFSAEMRGAILEVTFRGGSSSSPTHSTIPIRQILHLCGYEPHPESFVESGSFKTIEDVDADLFGAYERDDSPVKRQAEELAAAHEAMQASRAAFLASRSSQ